jgi:hypothetical protein
MIAAREATAARYRTPVKTAVSAAAPSESVSVSIEWVTR